MNVLDRVRSSIPYADDSNTQKTQNTLLTLPISCQICLGKVKDPAVCSNHHAFCKTCLEQWTQKSPFCPACRVPINEANPYKKILGSMDEATQEQINDPALQSQLRRTRLKMLFEEFHNEIDYLEEKLVKFATENNGLKSENDHLREQLEESELKLVKLQPKEDQDGETKTDQENKVLDATGGGDIKTILKLSNKLQEMINVNESITDVNTSLRKELKNVRAERDMYIEDMQRTKEENRFTHSPQKYNRYAMAALQTKVESYEREIQQLKKALKRADEYMGKSTSEFKRNTNATNGNTIEKGLINKSSFSESDFLKQLLGSPGRCIRDEKQMSSARSFIEKILIEESQKDVFAKTPKRPSSAPSEQDKVVDALRFPACAKLIELTKVRSNATNVEPSEQMLYNSDRDFPDNGPQTGTNGTSKHETFVPRNIDGDDITVVIPSSDSPSWANQEWQFHEYDHSDSARKKEFLSIKRPTDQKEYNKDPLGFQSSSMNYGGESNAIPSKKVKMEKED